MINTIKDTFIDTEYTVLTAENRYTLKRVNNDVYGNPLYMLYSESGSVQKTRTAIRSYYAKGYYLLQSYNIKNTIEKLFEELNENVMEVLEK